MPFVAGGAARQARRSWRHALYAGDVGGGRARDRAVPGAGRRRSPTWCSRCPTRRSTRRRTGDYHPHRGGAHDVRRRGRSPTSRRRSSSTSTPRTRRCAWRSSGCSAARWPGCRPTPPPSRTAASRIMVNVAAFYEGADDQATAQGLGRRTSRRRCARTTPARTSTSWATRARRGSAMPTPGRPGTGWRAIKARYDPTNLFRLNQNIPPADGSPG